MLNIINNATPGTSIFFDEIKVVGPEFERRDRRVVDVRAVRAHARRAASGGRHGRSSVGHRGARGARPRPRR